MKFRYPVSSSTRNRAAAEGRSRGSLCAVIDTAVLVTNAAFHPAAEAKRGLPGRVRRRDPPGVRWRPGDWHAPPTGYLQEATRDTRGPDHGACAGPGSARPRRPRPYSPRSRPGLARRSLAGRAGDRRPGAAPRDGPPAVSARTPSASASVRLREARAVTVAPADRHRRQARAGQALTRARPLRRRAARIARPARVRMRSRNPCVFARWRLFGWNVRLLTGTPGQRVRSVRPPDPDVRAVHVRKPALAVAGPMNGTRAGCRRSNRRPASSPRPGQAPHWRTYSPGTPPGRSSSHHAATLRNTSRLPNEHRSRALGCGQRFRARGSGTGRPAGSHHPGRPMGRAAAPSATCTTCGKTC